MVCSLTWASERSEEDPNSCEKIIFNNEVHFLINGYMKKQSCRIWDDLYLHDVHHVAMVRTSWKMMSKVNPKDRYVPYSER